MTPAVVFVRFSTASGLRDKKDLSANDDFERVPRVSSGTLLLGNERWPQTPGSV